MFSSALFRRPARCGRPCLAAVLLALVALGTFTAAARTAAAQTWNEAGDAGPLPASAQTTVGLGPLTQIAGALTSPADVDMFCIRVTDVAGFHAQVACDATLGPSLWLFDASGRGVAATTLCQGGAESISGAFLPGTGTYYLALSFQGVIPFAGADAIWLPGSAPERAPDGPGAAGVVTQWTTGVTILPVIDYQVALAAATFCEAPTPAMQGTWGTVKALYR